METEGLLCSECPNLVILDSGCGVVGCLKPGTRLVYTELALYRQGIKYIKRCPPWCCSGREGHACGRVGEVPIVDGLKVTVAVGIEKCWTAKEYRDMTVPLEEIIRIRAEER